MDNSKVIGSELICQLAEDNLSFKNFLEDVIKTFIRLEKSFLICSMENFPPVIAQKDEEGILVAFVSELQNN